MEITLYNAQGTTAGTVNAPDALVAAPANADLVYQVATTQMANLRQPWAHTKDRSDVRGGGRKPWRQKGTGRARHGSTRSPIWIGGGATHGPVKERSFAKTVTRSASRTALACVLSDRHAQGRLLVVDELALDGKTKSANTVLKALTPHFPEYVNRKDKQSRILVVLGGAEKDEQARRSLANMSHVGTIRAVDLNVTGVLSYPYLLMTKDALEAVQARMSK